MLLANAIVRGEVDLADPLSKHLRTPRPRWRTREPTLLELATHRSGLPNTPRSLHRAELRYATGLRRESPWAFITQGEYHQRVGAESPRQTPGARARYSSIGVGLLGDALAARAGTDYTLLFDGPPTLRPMEGLLTWLLGESRGVQLWRDEKRAGHSALTLEVDDLDGLVIRLSSAGVKHGDIQPSGGACLVALTDPDGNEVVVTGK